MTKTNLLRAPSPPPHALWRATTAATPPNPQHVGRTNRSALRPTVWAAKTSPTPAPSPTHPPSHTKKRLQSADGTVVCGDGGGNTYGRSSKQVSAKYHWQVFR